MFSQFKQLCEVWRSFMGYNFLMGFIHSVPLFQRISSSKGIQFEFYYLPFSPLIYFHNGGKGSNVQECILMIAQIKFDHIIIVSGFFYTSVVNRNLQLQCTKAHVQYRP